MLRKIGFVLWASCVLAIGCDGDGTLGEPCTSAVDCNAGEVCDPTTMVCVEPSDAGDGTDGGTMDGGDTDAGDGDGGTGSCGDGVVTAPETCDDGNTVSGDGCDDMCQLVVSATCGDGTLDASEECDDGNTTAGDGCDDSCRVEVSAGCGDGMTDFSTGEQCDDGNNVSGDGCSATCQLEMVGASCGDGTMDPGEVCDDSNVVNGDGCNPTCNLTTTVSTFVGTAGMRGSMDGVGPAARIRGGVLAVDDDYVWFGENGNCRMGSVPANLRRIEIATATVTTITTMPSCEVAGIATNGSGMVWAAGTDQTSGESVIFEIDTTAMMPTATVIAGNNPCMAAGCYADDTGGGTATFGGIRGLTWWGGLLYIVDPAAGVVRSLDPSTGSVTNLAGDPFNNGIVDGTGAAAQFQSPRYIVSDGTANLYVSETNSGTIRRVNALTGAVTTFAGNGMSGYVDAAGAAARSHRPRGITADGTSVYWVEFNAHAVRQGVVATGEVSTLAGQVTLCSAGCMGGTTCNNDVCLPPGGGPPMGGGTTDGVGTMASLFAPFGIAFHYPSNSLFFTNGSNTIRRIQ